MADERREHEYDVAKATIIYLAEWFNKKLGLTESNPIRKERMKNRKLTEEEYQAEVKEGWDLMRMGLLLMCEERGG